MSIKTRIVKYLSLAVMLVTVAWFFWNPEGWSFDWEPIVVGLTSIITFIGLEWKDTRTAHPSDVSLFKQLVELLPSTGVMHFLKTHDFGGAFLLDKLHPIREFVDHWDNAEHEFQGKDLERLRVEFYEACLKFDKLITNYTSLNDSGYQSVRPSSYDGGREREFEFQREAEEINGAANVVVEKHQELVREGRRKLGDGSI